MWTGTKNILFVLSLGLHLRAVNLFFASMNCIRIGGGAFDSAKNHKHQRRKRQSVTAKREKSQTPKFV